MASRADNVVKFRPRAPIDLTLPSADRRGFVRYPSGHDLRVNREHLEKVLAAKAAIINGDY